MINPFIVVYTKETDQKTGKDKITIQCLRESEITTEKYLMVDEWQNTFGDDIASFLYALDINDSLKTFFDAYLPEDFMPQITSLNEGQIALLDYFVEAEVYKRIANAYMFAEE